MKTEQQSLLMTFMRYLQVQTSIKLMIMAEHRYTWLP